MKTNTTSLSNLFTEYQKAFTQKGWIWKHNEELIMKLKEECLELQEELKASYYASKRLHIHSILEEAADVVIVSFAFAKMHGYDFESIITERLRNNLERLERAAELLPSHEQIGSNAISECWDATRRSLMNWASCEQNTNISKP